LLSASASAPLAPELPISPFIHHLFLLFPFFFYRYKIDMGSWILQCSPRGSPPHDERRGPPYLRREHSGKSFFTSNRLSWCQIPSLRGWCPCPRPLVLRIEEDVVSLPCYSPHPPPRFRPVNPRAVSEKLSQGSPDPPRPPSTRGRFRAGPPCSDLPGLALFTPQNHE